jgi:hypothetical protein
MKKILIFLWITCLYAFDTDYDCVVVGTNPISMFEAIYKRTQGDRVLVVEQASECGGAWKSITICGVPNVDLGCHEFGQDQNVQKFLEVYAGCAIVQNGVPGKNNNMGFYPAHGCYELTHNLELLMKKVGVILALNSKLESVFIDTEREIAEVKVNGIRFTTRKIVVTHSSNIQFENPQLNQAKQNQTPQKYPHIYLLISDPTPSKFTYLNLSVSGCSRAMNVTRFVGLEGTGTQLIAIQVHNTSNLNDGQKYLDELKRLGHIDAIATLISVETYVFEQNRLNQSAINQVKPATIFEILNTSHITNIRNYIDKWKQGIKPWTVMMDVQ